MGRYDFYNWLESEIAKGHSRMNARDYNKVENYQIRRLKDTGRWPVDLPPHQWRKVSMQELMCKPLTV
jgi:hypothetical protein